MACRSPGLGPQAGPRSTAAGGLGPRLAEEPGAGSPGGSTIWSPAAAIVRHDEQGADCPPVPVLRRRPARWAGRCPTCGEWNSLRGRVPDPWCEPRLASRRVIREGGLGRGRRRPRGGGARRGRHEPATSRCRPASASSTGSWPAACCRARPPCSGASRARVSRRCCCRPWRRWPRRGSAASW